VSAFLDDVADDLERVSTFACPIILMGDVNIHLDVADDPHVIKWRSAIDSHGLVQHVTSPTHKLGHILDVIVTRSDCPVTDVRTEPPSLSDHSYITFSVDLQFSRSQCAGTDRRRQWRRFDYDKFCNDLCQSDLICDPPTDAVDLVTCYWLPVQHRITYKLCLLMHLVHNNRAPSYLVDSVTATASLSHRGVDDFGPQAANATSSREHDSNLASAASPLLVRQHGTAFRRHQLYNSLYYRTRRGHILAR